MDVTLSINWVVALYDGFWPNSSGSNATSAIIWIIEISSFILIFSIHAGSAVMYIMN